MVRASVLLPYLILGGCDEPAGTKRERAPEIANQPLPADVVRAMLAAGEPCLRQFRPSMPDAYPATLWVTQNDAGLLAVEFRTGDRPPFNKCIVDAIRTARIPAKLAAPAELPMMFDFTTVK